ncbi:hydrogenase maturation protease [Anaerobacillus sp. CMMVII]|uniref:hydrogenase maturation protease n=1 Tax=Anaerobacillus sp. CMMVII TaxID=2755588 RepID=UPI0021B82442|nr:hydrogenase maturation protease [Anaerobacillus sp. CMMVII]MCT8139181.1 hydrogenase maturation protease [Anaerobacillus sp. CMMVII]
MERIIVLGIGNQLMMDDGIGIYLVDELSKVNVNTSISYVVGEADIDYCLKQIEGATFIIIVDAVCSGGEPGDLKVFSLANLHESKPLDISPHNLHLFQVLYHQRETLKGFLIGIEPYRIEFHIGLSEPLKEKWDQILSTVQQTIECLIDGY